MLAKALGGPLLRRMPLLHGLTVHACLAFCREAASLVPAHQSPRRGPPPSALHLLLPHGCGGEAAAQTLYQMLDLAAGRRAGRRAARRAGRAHVASEERNQLRLAAIGGGTSGSTSFDVSADSIGCGGTRTPIVREQQLHELLGGREMDGGSEREHRRGREADDFLRLAVWDSEPLELLAHQRDTRGRAYT